ncbi:MAG TPA: site-specific integrase [Spirochaetia bacterium]|nr:site-specific integrase [Spirochaetia bacterium]
MKHAVKWELVGRNVADATEPPIKEDYEADSLNEQQILDLLDVAKDTPLYIAILLALSTGMRRGEVLGLRWQDIDFKTFRIHIKQTILPPLAKGEPVVVSTPKTKKSKRTVTLPHSIIPDIKKHKTEQGKERISHSDIYQNNDLVVCRPDGTPLNPGSFSHQFGNLLDSNGLPHVRFHDLRHTHASRLLENGVDSKTISERLGHSDVGTTLKTYSHVSPKMRDKSAEVMDEILRKRLG